MTLSGWYEAFAPPVQAWRDATKGVMLAHTPLLVICTYGGCMVFIALAALAAFGRGAWRRAVAGGVFIGAGLMFSAVFWFSRTAR
jgi:hypothetical protein